MARPYQSLGIDALEALVRENGSNRNLLRDVRAELSRRSTRRAAALRARVDLALASLSTGEPQADRSAFRAAAPQGSDPPVTASARSAGQADRKSGATVATGAAGPAPTNDPVGILDAWTALEVLSPPCYRRAEQLAGGEPRDVIRLGAAALPWEVPGARARPGTQLYYQVVLGSIDMALAVERLCGVFADGRAERPAAQGRAIIAAVVLDREGLPAGEPCCAVSSFAWGLPVALGGDLRGLADWPEAERDVVEALDRLLRRVDSEGKPRPLDLPTIRSAYAELVNRLGLPSDLVAEPEFVVRSYQYYKLPDPPEPLLLNSFFLGDLGLARRLFQACEAPETLRRYLGVLRPERRRDLLSDADALSDALRPDRFPAARWPGPGRHPLVLLQQAAVNLAFDARDGGIIAVNGPPGTGKTTLLRDIVAALVAERAKALARFDDPEAAFQTSGERMRAGQGWLHLYRLDPSLRGFEIVVASSNNKAVENVSAELPAIGSIADDAADLRHLSTVSTALLERESWGLIAAILGNASNRARFRQTFWWNDDHGLSRYLAEAAGTPQILEERDEQTGLVTSRPPLIVQRENPPRGKAEALERWHRARSRFRAALARAEAAITETADAARLGSELRALRDAAAASRTATEAVAAALDQVAAKAERARAEAVRARQESEAANRELAEHQARKPGLAVFLRLQAGRAWRDRDAALRTLATAADTRAREAQIAAETAETDRRAVVDRAERLRREVVEAEARLKDAEARLQRAAPAPQRALDDAFFGLRHAERHRAVPWLSDETHRLRDELFVSAVLLHRAFLDAAAKPMRHNLGALMTAFGRRSLGSEARDSLLSDLWSTLFLVVPVISTTFASVERMFGALGPGSIGWLLIDEAGQAVPQAAVGALMRARHPVVVGDPMQIEPVVQLPPSLTTAICHRFGVEPERFDAPDASVQTLADRATPYAAEFAARLGSRVVGVPLLVHRRCAEPMFGISNAVAYDGLMVQAKAPAVSPIRDLLGPSRWFHVEGAAQDKWCPQEGELVIELLAQMARSIGVPDIYVITPFVVVQDNLRRLVSEGNALRLDREATRRWARERIGTVHTVQGREAEAVVLVLGAPAPQQSGARGWAGGRPNLLNVAVTRAKDVLYVVGNRSAWRTAGVFSELDRRLP